jgi:hypothetical protein
MLHWNKPPQYTGLGAESMDTANTRREKSLLMNRMTYARKQISRNGKKKWEKEIVHFSLEIYSNAAWEVGEQGSFLDFNIKYQGLHPLLYSPNRGALHSGGYGTLHSRAEAAAYRAHCP